MTNPRRVDPLFQESLREKFNIHNVLVGLDCCVDKREQSNDWSDFMFYDQFVDSTYTLVSQVLQKCLVLKVKLPKSQPVSRITVSGPVNFTSTTSDLGLFYALLDRKNIAEYGSDDDDKSKGFRFVSSKVVGKPAKTRVCFFIPHQFNSEI